MHCDKSGRLKNLNKQMKDEKGFTLIEMLVVIFIIGVIIAIALPNFMSAGEKAQQRADEANRRLISAQADNYYLENGEYPTSVEELVKNGYLRSVPKCPGGKGEYRISRGKGATNRVTCSVTNK